MLRFLIRQVATLLVSAVVLSFFIYLVATPRGVSILFHPLENIKQISQYGSWAMTLLHGDFGYSGKYHEPVTTLIGQRLPLTLSWVLIAFILQQAGAVFIGTTSAIRPRQGRFMVYSSTIISTIPAYLLAVLLILVLGVWIPIFTFRGVNDVQASGEVYGTPGYWAYAHQHPLAVAFDLVHHLGLPVLVLAILGFVTDAQLVRTSMQNVMEQEYMRAVRARGLPQRLVIWRHGLRNALLPLLASLATQLPALLFTAAIIEFVFAIPGVSNLLIGTLYQTYDDEGHLIFRPDFPIITAFFIILGVGNILMSFVTTVLYAAADPRIRATD